MLPAKLQVRYMYMYGSAMLQVCYMYGSAMLQVGYMYVVCYVAGALYVW